VIVTEAPSGRTSKSVLTALVEQSAGEYNGTFADVSTKALRSGGFVMSGSTTKTVGAVNTSTQVGISLKRTVAKVALQTTIAPEFSEKYPGSITINSVKLSRAASQSLIAFCSGRGLWEREGRRFRGEFQSREIAAQEQIARGVEREDRERREALLPRLGRSRGIEEGAGLHIIARREGDRYRSTIGAYLRSGVHHFGFLVARSKQRSGESRHRKNSVFHGCKIWKVIERWLFEVFRKRCRAFRALVARHTVFVDPPADGPSKPLLEQPEFGTLGKVIPQRRALEDR